MVPTQDLATRCWRRVVIGVVCAAILLFPVSPFPTAPSPSAQEITWTPSSIHIRIVPGASQQCTVFFTASRTFGAGAVHIPPELQPFVQVEPRQLTGIVQGQRVPLSLTISVPRRARPGTVTGAMRLFSELQLGVKGGGIKTLSWPFPFANPLLIMVNIVPHTGDRASCRNGR